MTNHSAAARVWAAIENKLLRLRMIYDGRDLREHRADLVRATGEALGNSPDLPRSPPLRLDDSAPVVRVERTPAIQHQRIARGTKVADGAIARQLEQYLNAAHKAGGYAGDDEVGYGRR